MIKVEPLSVDKRGLVDPAVYPCHKADGKCRVKRLPDAKDFQCKFIADYCRFREKEKGGK